MRYGLLDLAACQQCHAPLTALAAAEVPSEMPQGLQPAATRVAPGIGIGPVAPGARDTPLNAILRRHARPPAADVAGNFAVEIAEGRLVCGDCGRWYPIAGQLPEILPDHLRDAARDNAILRSLAAAMPDEVRGALAPLSPRADAADGGAHYKAAEMAIASKVNDPEFFATRGRRNGCTGPACGRSGSTSRGSTSRSRSRGWAVTAAPDRRRRREPAGAGGERRRGAGLRRLSPHSRSPARDGRLRSRAPSGRARRVRRARRAARDQRRGGRRDDEVRDSRARHGAGRRDRLHGGDAPDARRAGLRLAALRSAGGPRGLGGLSEEAPPLRRQHLSHQPRRPRRAIRGRAIAPRTARRPSATMRSG